MPLEQLGPYRIGRRLGRGGMGTVYEGFDIDGNHPSAIKVLSASLAHEEGFRERFDAEIESLRKLKHPNVVRLHGYGEQDGVLFYAMELVEGRSLEEELESGRRFDWREVTRMGIQICLALQHAHDRGVVHRDLKPGNLLLTEEGHVKLSDFGIARLFGNVGLTADGGVLGTAEYMAPEQADGRPVTDRADLYSLGGVLYALLARRAPFRAATMPEMLQLQRFAEPDPVRRYAPDAPAELERIISQLLEKNPEARIPTAKVVARRLEAMEHGLSIREGSQGALDADGAELAKDAILDQSNSVVPVDSHAERSAPRLTPATLPETLSGESVEKHADGEASQARSQPTIPSPVKRRFVPVQDELADSSRPASDGGGVLSLQTLGPLIGLAAIVGIIWYSVQPPSTTDLYSQVVNAAEGGGETLAPLESEIDTLLTERSAELSANELEQLRKYQDEAALYRMERRFEREARDLKRADTLLPVERAYLEAIKYLKLDRARGMRKLRALVDLYGVSPDPSPTVERCLELARRQLAQYESETERFAEADLAVLNERLQAAERIMATDSPAARAIWQGMIELYGDEPWAAEPIEKARRALARTSSELQTSDAR